MHSGKLLSGDIPLSVWQNNNQGYVYGRDLENVENHQLALAYIKEKNFCNDSQYSHEDDCYYLENNCHIEERGGHRYLRPSNCSKFVLKQGKHLFTDYSWLYSYHGTAPRNVRNIMTYGLAPSGTIVGGKKVKQANGSVLGKGVYTTKLPLYAQLYAATEIWRGLHVQTLFLVRQRPESITQHGAEGCHTTNMIGRTDLHRLYGGLVGENEVQFVTSQWSGTIVLQALLVKIHTCDPSGPGGEYTQISRLLDRLDAK
jgi:hypothetical protein